MNSPRNDLTWRNQVLPFAIGVAMEHLYYVVLTILSLLISFNPTVACMEFVRNKSSIKRKDIQIGLEPIASSQNFYRASICWKTSFGKQFLKAPKSFPLIFFLFFSLLSFCFLVMFPLIGLFLSLDFFFLTPIYKYSPFDKRPFYYHAIVLWSTLDTSCKTDRKSVV